MELFEFEISVTEEFFKVNVSDKVKSDTSFKVQYRKYRNCTVQYRKYRKCTESVIVDNSL